MIHVIGDSRVRQFAKLPDVQIHEAGGIPMHVVATMGLRIDLSRWKSYPETDCIFVFGEVDARIHFPRIASDSGCSIVAVIDSVVDRYISAVRAFCVAWRLRGFVCSIIPPVDLETATPGALTGLTGGSLAERVDWVTRSNARKQAVCAEQGLIFFDPYAPFRTPEQILDYRFSDGIVHLADSCQEYVRDNFLMLRESIQLEQTAIFPAS